MPIVRYPGGNFVSGYNWLDGVGPKAQRPTVLERAWNSIETNQFGTNEFIEWCGMVGAEPLLGMNFGTGTVEMAVAYVEYCNLDRGTRWSELQTRARLRSAAQRPLLVPRQRDGRAVADRPAAGARVRPQGARRRQADAGHRSGPAAHRLRIERHVHADVSHLGPRSPRGVLRPGGRHLAARLLRQHEGVVGQQHRALPGDEPRHGSPHPRDGGGLRLRAGAAEVEQAAVAVVRRVERLVPRAGREGHRRQTRRRAAAARGGLQPRGRAAGRRLRQHAAPQFRPRARRLPGAARQRDRAARDQRHRRAAPEHLLSLHLGAALRARARARSARRVGDLSDQSGRPAGRFRARWRPCRSSTSSRRSTTQRTRPRCWCSIAISKASASSCSSGRTSSDARPRLRDADRRRSEGGQHVRQIPGASSRSGSSRRRPAGA